MTYVLGITGSFGSGKSTVAGMFGEAGAVLVDADEIARKVVQPNTPIMEELADTFGGDIITDHNRLDRQRLADIVFGDPQKTSWLNAIIHPEVREEILRRMEEVDESVSMLVLDIPLLFESGMQDIMDGIAVVVTEEEMRFERLVARGISPLEVERRLEHQMPQSEKLRQADFVIDNAGSIENTHLQVKNLVQSLGVMRN